MRKYKAIYGSMTARYDLGYYYANSKEEAEREARATASAFSEGEKSLIHCYDATNEVVSRDEE